MFRALVALVALQVQRTQEALIPNESRFKLDELASDPNFFDHVVSITLQRQQLISATVRNSEWVAFPSLGWFMLPLIGADSAIRRGSCH